MVAASFTFRLGAVLGLAARATVAGVVCVGNNPLVDVGGVLVTPGSALAHVAASWASVLVPVLAFSALAMAVSICTRSSVLGVMVPVVIGLVFQMYTFLNAWDTVRHILLNTTMNAWRGMFDSPSYNTPVERGLAIALVYLVVSIFVGLVVFRRRDVTGG
jgi:ABC-2 type transport system permease protein